MSSVRPVDDFKFHKSNYAKAPSVSYTSQIVSQPQVQPNASTSKNVLKWGAVVAGVGMAIATGKVYSNIANKKIKHNELVNSIIIRGKENFKQILSGLVHDDFDSSKTFRANFHIHSTASDGKLTPLEILKQASEYAAKLPKGEKFNFSVTDHDGIDGVVIIANEISKHPEKYTNLRFIPGIELSAKYHNPNLSGKPIEFDFLIYGFDVKNPKLIEQIAKRKNYLSQKTTDLFKDINEQYGLHLSLAKMQEKERGHLKNMASNGYLKALQKYVKDRIVESGVVYNEDVVSALIQKHFNHTRYAFDANMTMQDAVKLCNEIDAFSSLAHLGKLNLGHAELKTAALKVSDDLISEFVGLGGTGIESHYMSYKQGNMDWWQNIRNSFKKLNLTYSRTGGYDTHGGDIGKH